MSKLVNTDRQRVAIVTGASSGIGKETALRLLAEGYSVHAGARRLGAMRDLTSKGVHIHPLDLTNAESIAAFVSAVRAREGERVDVLVNNAGYGAYGAVEDVPLEDGRQQMEVNFFGLVQMIKAVLPAMREQRSGRIINVTSIGGKVWSLLGAWYHASKFAVEGFSDSLRNEVRPFGIDVVVVEPGGTKTEWGHIAVESMRAISGAGPYKPLVDGWLKLSQLETGFAEASDIADVIVRAATVRRPRTRYVAPLSGQVAVALRWLLSDRAFDWLFSRMFRVPRSIPAAS
jgi:NAD(P)-dependent dehydrogenase (short-subunit alcohol dehydrogenase family)